MQPLSLGSPSGDMLQDEYMLTASGYPSPYEPTSSVPSPFGSDSFADSFSSEKTDDFDSKARMSILLVCVVMIGLLGLAAFIYVETSRAGDSSGEGVEAEVVGSKGFDGGPSVPTPRNNTTGPRTVYKTSAGTSTTVRPSGPRIAADFFNSVLNRSFAPCGDFYNFVCSKYDNAFFKMMDQAKAGVRATLSDMHVPANFQKASEKAAGLYQACVSFASNARRSELEPVKALLSSLHLDISNIDNDPSYDIPPRLVNLSFVHGFPTFAKFSVYWSPGEGKRLEVWIHEDDEKWMNDQHKKTRPNLLEFYRGFLEAYDPNINSKGLSERIVKSEVVVKNFIATIRKARKRGLGMTLSRFGRFITGYDSSAWARLIGQASSGKYNARSPITMWDNATAVMSLLLDKRRMARADARLLMSWSLFRRLLTLGSGQRLAAEASSSYPSRADRIPFMCYKKILAEMPLAAAHRWFDTMVPPPALDDAKRLGTNLKRALMNKLKKTRWIRGGLWCMMNTKTNIVPLDIGLPEDVSSESMFEDFFRDVPDIRDSFTAPFLETRRVMTLHHFSKRFNVYWNIPDKNAAYNPNQQAVSIYGSMLQPPVFIYDAPAAVNYGGLGQIVGHELMHPFDPANIMFGKARLGVQFENTTAKKLYTGKVLCLRNSYYQAESEGRGRTLSGRIDSEGFVDYAGIQLAYYAFKRLPEKERTATVPDIGLTADQTFFVSHCVKYCTTLPGSKRASGSLYWHGRSRCIVPLRNMPEFAEAFKCKSGDRMNPETRCSFW